MSEPSWEGARSGDRRIANHPRLWQIDKLGILHIFSWELTGVGWTLGCTVVERSGGKPAFESLANAELSMRKLDALCCKPGRSARMAALATKLSRVRSDLDRLDEDAEGGDALLERLDEAWLQVGRLQTGCCTPARLPLYVEILTDLTTAQLDADEWLGRGR